MKEKKDWRSELEQVAVQLRDPFRMRMAVAGVTLAVMCFAISDPLHGRMKTANRELTQLKSTVRTADEVMLLRDHLEAVEPRLMKGGGNDIVVSHLIELVRGESVDLMRIDAETPTRIGPMESINVSIDVTGSFESLNQLLYRLDTDRYLLRVETVAINPAERERPTPTMQLSLQILKDPS